MRGEGGAGIRKMVGKTHQPNGCFGRSAVVGTSELKFRNPPTAGSPHRAKLPGPSGALRPGPSPHPDRPHPRRPALPQLC